MRRIIVLYHEDCWDGFGGAWAAWKKFGNRATYIGLKHDGTAGDIVSKLKGHEVYAIDFSFPESEYRGAMKKLVQDNGVVILDHHISGEKATKLAHRYVFDLNHSGATIAWHYFHERKKAPKLLLHIEDMDLWHFKLPKTKEIFSYLQMFDYDFRAFDKLVTVIENPATRKRFVEKGADLLRYEGRLIQRLLKNAEVVKFAGYKVLVVNSPVLVSEIGHELVKRMPPLGIIWNENNGMINVSLRSNGKADVAKIAERFGGGGHKAAAGFGVPLGKFPWKVLKKNAK